MEQMTIPLARKHDLRSRIAELLERAKGAQKAASRQKAEEAQRMARQIAESAATSLETMVVAVLDVGSDRNALQAGLRTIQDRCPGAAVMLLSPDTSDPDAPRVSIVAGVPRPLIDRGLRAGDWVREAAAVVRRAAASPETRRAGAATSGG